MKKLCNLFLFTFILNTGYAATFTVTNLNDLGAGSFRQAITNANSSGGTDIIDATGISGTISLASTLPDISDVTINGPTTGTLTLDGTDNFRIMTVSGTVTINNLVIKDGYVSTVGGAGILVSGILTLNKCKVTSSSVPSGVNGAGILVTSGNSLTLIRTEVSSNSSQNFGGGISIQGTCNITDSSVIKYNHGLTGGGIHNNGTCTINSSIVELNDVTGSGIAGGGGIYNLKNLTIQNNSFIRNNSATYYGGGIYNEVSAATVNLSNSTISDNQLTDNSTNMGGGLYLYAGSAQITGCTFSGNQSQNGAGGALYFRYGTTFTLSDCSFESNSALDGGGIYSELETNSSISNCTFSNNTTVTAGGIGGCAIYYDAGSGYPSTVMTVNNCTFTGNGSASISDVVVFASTSMTLNNCSFINNNTTSTYGGTSLVHDVGTLNVNNCTFSGNKGNAFESTLSTNVNNLTNCTFSKNYGSSSAGIYLYAGALKLKNCTLTKNTYAILQPNGSSIDMDNTILIGNGTYDLLNGMTVNSTNGRNLIGSIEPGTNLTGSTAGNITGVNILSVLDTNLVDNGGSTFTHALLPCSPAINAGYASGAPALDQRGFSRVGVIDIGAFEYQSIPGTIPAISTQGTDQDVCESSSASFSITASGSPLSYKWQVNAGSGFSNLSNSALYSNVNTATLDISSATASMNGYQYRCVVSGCYPDAVSSTYTLMVHPVPVVTGAPGNQSVTQSGTANFSVSATGSNLSYQWLENTGSGFSTLSNTGIYSGTNSSTLTLTGVTSAMDTYTYACVVTGCGGADDTSAAATLNVQLTGVKDISEKYGLTIFPNPSDGYFILSFNNNMKTYTVSLLNSLGDEIGVPTVVNNQTSFLNLNKGVYFLRINVEEEIFYKKVVIE